MAINMNRMTHASFLPAILAASICITTSTTSFGDDWPGWMGPGRDNVWNETGIMDMFPESGPKVKWRVPVAGGYAGPAVANGRVLVTDYQTKADAKISNFERKDLTGTERVLCFDEMTGRLIWSHSYPVRYTMSYPAGPRCTPLIHEGRVYTLGGEGMLACFDFNTGKVIWSKDLKAEYKTKSALWGYAGHPLIDGDNLICVAGGEGSHAVALNQLTGDETWRALSSSEQGYCPPTLITAGGKRQLILAHPDAVDSVDPATGKSYWSVPYEATNGSIIMSPVIAGDYLYMAGYSKKNLLIELAPDRPSAQVVWRDLPKQAMSPVNVQPIFHDGVLYGYDQGGLLIGMDLESGKRLWQTPQPLADKRPLQTGTAFLVRQASRSNRFWLFSEQGDLVIADLTPSGYQEISRAKVIEPSNVAFGRKVVWSAPAYANRHAFIRNDNELIRVDLSSSKLSLLNPSE